MSTPSLRRIVTLALALSLMPMMSGCGALVVTVGAQEEGLERSVVARDEGWPWSRVAIIDVSGVLVNGHRSGVLSQGEHPVNLLHEQLALAERDPWVKAVILRINSPGGTVTASDAMYREVIRFKERTGKPVVVLMMDVAASGGYYVACAGDHILAYPSTVTGSVGVILQTMSLKPLLGKIGVETLALTSGPNKAMGSPLESLKDEHKALLQGMVDDFYARFVEIVRASRPRIPADRFAQVVDGRVFTGTQAVPLGVVDELGDVYDAWRVAKRLAGVERAHLLRYHRPLQNPASPYAGAPQRTPEVQFNLAQINLDTGQPFDRAGFFYLWQPTAHE